MSSNNDTIPSHQPTRIVAVTSGKGGVGKTSVSVNLAVSLAKEGARVCVLDADTGLANINILLGLVPRHTLEHVFSGERDVADIVLHGPGGIDIIPGASGLVSHVHLDADAQYALINGLQALEQRYDYLIIDTAAGISATVLHFVASAQTALVVITPEPTSLTDAFSLLKVLRQKGYKRPVQVVINMVADSRQAWRIFERFNAAVEKYIGLQTQWLASIPRDDGMRRAIMIQKPITLHGGDSPACESFSKMAAMLEQFFHETTVPSAVFSRYWRRVFERIAERAAARGQVTAKAPSQPASTDSLAVTQALMSADEESLDPDSGAALEKRWTGARRELLALLESQQITSDQMLQLFGELVDAAGESIGQFGVDLAYYLLSRCSPGQLQPEQKQLLDLELFRLGVRASLKDSFAEKESLSANEHQPAKQRISSNHARMATNPPAQEQATLRLVDREVARKHGFDEAGFGSQEELLRRLQEASHGESLTALLASLRHASLVREE